MDIKEKIEELVKKITSDEQLLASFKKDPIKAVEKLIGIDLPDDQIKSIVDGIKAKIAIDDISATSSVRFAVFSERNKNFLYRADICPLYVFLPQENGYIHVSKRI